MTVSFKERFKLKAEVIGKTGVPSLAASPLAGECGVVPPMPKAATNVFDPPATAKIAPTTHASQLATGFTVAANPITNNAGLSFIPTGILPRAKDNSAMMACDVAVGLPSHNEACMKAENKPPQRKSKAPAGRGSQNTGSGYDEVRSNRTDAITQHSPPAYPSNSKQTEVDTPIIQAAVGKRDTKGDRDGRLGPLEPRQNKSNQLVKPALEVRPKTDPPPRTQKLREESVREPDVVHLPPIGKRPVAYEPYTLESYRAKKDEWAKKQCGGLGPSDTDEQRAAAAKYQRQREYAENVKKINRMLLVAQQDNSSGGEAEQESPSAGRGGHHSTGAHQRFVSPAQPPAAEVVERLQRRERALSYAKGVPKPRLRITEGHVSLDPANDEDTIDTQGEGALDNMLSDLEAKHEQDQRVVEGIRRQLRI